MAKKKKWRTLNARLADKAARIEKTQAFIERLNKKVEVMKEQLARMTVVDTPEDATEQPPEQSQPAEEQTPEPSNA